MELNAVESSCAKLGCLMPCLIAEASHQSQKLARSSPISSGSSAQRTECKSCHGSIKATDLYYTCSVCDRRGIYCWPCALAAFRFDDHSLLVSSMNLPKSAFQMMQYAADAGVHIWGARAWKFMTPCSRLEAKYVYCLWKTSTKAGTKATSVGISGSTQKTTCKHAKLILISLARSLARSVGSAFFQSPPQLSYILQ